MKIQEVSTDEIIINSLIATRASGQSDEAIAKIAKSFLERFEANMEPIQINPGLGRAVNGKYELIDGAGRLGAVELVNEAGGLGGEPMLFRMQVVRAEDEAAIISGIQANFHEAVDVFDRADAMAKLVALGKTMAEVGKVFSMSDATVVQMMKLIKLQKRFVKAYRDGDIDQDGLLALADLETDDPKRTEILEEALRHSERMNTILTKLEVKKEKEQIVEQIEEKKATLEELTVKAKDATKRLKEADKTLTAAKGPKETEKARAAKAAIEKERKELGTALAKTEKEVLKLKDAKEKVAAKSAPKAKATGENVKEVAKEKGIKSKQSKTGPKRAEETPRSKNNLLVFLEGSIVESNKCSEMAKTLATRIQEYLAGVATETQLQNQFKRSCIADAE